MTPAHLRTAAAFIVWTALSLQGSVPGSAARAQAPISTPTMALNGTSDYPDTGVQTAEQDAAGVERNAPSASYDGGAASVAEHSPWTGDAWAGPLLAPARTAAPAPTPVAGPQWQDAMSASLIPADSQLESWDQTALGHWLGRPDLSRADLDFRFGYWARLLDGDPTLVAKYQGDSISPFFNVDGVFSNGVRTVELFATEMDEETDAARLNFYGPNLTARARFDRFIHRQENDPLTNFDSTKTFFRGINFNAGEDFATRIEMAKADFRGKLTENLQWRMDVRTIHKHGERQVRGLHRHVTCTQCHLAGARQGIDWTTVAVEPTLEGKFGPINVQLSHQSQVLTQNDQLIKDLDDGTPFFSQFLPYGYVADTYSQINRIRFDVDLMENTSLGANLFLGDTHNQFRGIHRSFNGINLQLTSRALDDRLSLTAFGKRLNDASQTTQQFVIPEEPALIQPLINYGRTSAGALARWRLFRRSESLMGLSLNGGYEYRQIDRENAVYLADQSFVNQPRTIGHLFHIGTNMDWSRRLDSYVRYKMESTQGPIYGVASANATFNSSLPEHVNLVEVGGNWMPEENLCINLSIDFQPAQNKSAVADFNETSLPMALTVSYSPVPRWTLSGGYMWDPIWISQRITLGDDFFPAVPDSNIWDYRGVSQRVHLGTRFALTDRTCLTSHVQYIRGQNTAVPPPSWSELPFYSNLAVQNVEISAGADWRFREHVLVYLHYNFSDYATQPTRTYDGTIHALLLGFNAFY